MRAVFVLLGLGLGVAWEVASLQVQEQQAELKARVLRLEGEVREHDRAIRRMEGELRRVPIPIPDH